MPILIPTKFQYQRLKSNVIGRFAKAESSQNLMEGAEGMKNFTENFELRSQNSKRKCKDEDGLEAIFKKDSPLNSQRKRMSLLQISNKKQHMQMIQNFLSHQ